MNWQFVSDPSSGRTCLLVWRDDLCAYRFDIPKPDEVTESDFILDTPLDLLQQQLGITRENRYFGHTFYVALELLRHYVNGWAVPELAMQGLA